VRICAYGAFQTPTDEVNPCWHRGHTDIHNTVRHGSIPRSRSQWVVGACTLRNRARTRLPGLDPHLPFTVLPFPPHQLTCLTPLGARQATGVRYDTRMVQIKQRNATHWVLSCEPIPFPVTNFVAEGERRRTVRGECYEFAVSWLNHFSLLGPSVVVVLSLIGGASRAGH
jgi:hypothetical protein